MKQGDFTLSRPQAICKHLIQEEEKSSDFYPSEDLKTRIKIDSDLDYDIMDLRDFVKNLVKYCQNPASSKFSEDQLREDLDKAMNLLEIMLSNIAGDYLNGESPTLSDFSIFSSVFEGVKRAQLNLKEYPLTEKWYENVTKLEVIKDLVGRFD